MSNMSNMSDIRDIRDIREEGLNLIGDRGPEFKELINSLLDECYINEKYIKKLTSKKSLSYFSTVFTHKSADLLNNYVFF